MSPYEKAQLAITQLKGAIHELLETGPDSGLRNADIGRALGIYAGHQGHEGHVPRTILAIMEREGVVLQDSGTKCWRLSMRPGVLIAED